ncbi:DUF559 domain-containing protein [Antrihabitans spumae]|uniref:DUF559 domain-containing protein n=1 Tax=Antrihabitans spumae TaxID=3373370 RepID=A0ABW7KQC1_9NOCA
MTPRAVHATMARQDGVISREQATRLGMTQKSISHRVTTGEWRRVSRGVYLRADREFAAAAQVRAAVFAAGEGAVADGPTAAWWHGLMDRPVVPHCVTIPSSRRIRPIKGVRVRHRTLHPADIVSRRHLAVVGLPLAVLEASVAIPRGAVLMDRALQRYTTLAQLSVVHERNAGRAGASAAARLLSAAGEGGASEAERMLLRLFRRAGVTGWQVHVRSLGFEIDVAFVRERVAIEVDGWSWHRDAERFARDGARQNILVNAGWHVLRYTWHDLEYESDRVLAEVATALRRAA